MRSALVLLVMASACGGATSSPLSVAPERSIAAQSQSLVESATGTYTLRFVADGDAPSIGLLQQAHELFVSQGDGELRIRLSSAEMSFTGLADELDEHRWLAGLAAVTPDTNTPVVLHMTALHAGDALTGSVVIDVGGETHTASFLARRSSAAAAVTAEADASATSTHYHLPDGLR